MYTEIFIKSDGLHSIAKILADLEVRLIRAGIPLELIESKIEANETVTVIFESPTIFSGNGILDAVKLATTGNVINAHVMLKF